MTKLGNPFKDQLWIECEGLLGVRLCDQIRGQTCEQLWDYIEGHLWYELMEQPWGQLENQLKDHLMGGA